MKFKGYNNSKLVCSQLLKYRCLLLLSLSKPYHYRHHHHQMYVTQASLICYQARDHLLALLT